MARTGRRKAGADTKTDLLQAGEQLLTGNGLQALSLRAIAEAAGTTPAMVHFHFGDRFGYLTALLDHGFERFFDGFNIDRPFPEAVSAIIARLAGHRWLVMLMVQTVYIGDELRAHFQSHHAPRLRAVYEQMISRGQREGHVDPGLDREPVTAALISLLIFPNIAGPAMTGPLARGDEAHFRLAYTVLIQNLFLPREVHHE